MDIEDFIGNDLDAQNNNLGGSCSFCQCGNSSEGNANYCSTAKGHEANVTPKLQQSFRKCRNFETCKINESDLECNSMSQKSNVSLLHVIKNLINKEDLSLADSSEVFHSFGEDTRVQFIDDPTEEETDHGLEQAKHGHSKDQLVQKFILHDSILSEQVNKSILEDSYQDDQGEHDINHFVFSTTSSRRLHSPIAWENIFGDEYCGDNSKLGCDVSLIENDIHNDSILSPVMEHRCSTPKKHKIYDIVNDNDMLYVHNESDEDVDIEEGYLDTVWISNKTVNLPSCRVFIKCLETYRESQQSQSMICKVEEVDAEIFSKLSLKNKRNELDARTTKHSPSKICGPMINNIADSSMQYGWKMSYKDKLMQGLHSNSIRSNMVIREDDGMLSVKKIPSMNFPFSSNLRDPNHNMVTKISIEEHPNSNAKNLIKINQDPWNEQKSNKNRTKRAHKSTSVPRMELHKVNESTKNDASTFRAKKKIILEEFNDGTANPTACISELYKVKQTKNSPIKDILKEKSTKRCSRKLKKFCSLDLSEYQGISTDAKNNPKWKGQDDPENSNPSSLKPDYLLWPLVGLAVFAGFVAFCFRDKISFMITSKFPFDRPPI